MTIGRDIGFEYMDDDVLNDFHIDVHTYRSVEEGGNRWGTYYRRSGLHDTDSDFGSTFDSDSCKSHSASDAEHASFMR